MSPRKTIAQTLAEFHDMVSDQFASLHQAIAAVDARCGSIEGELKDLEKKVSGGGMDFVGVGPGAGANFMKIEDKIAYLNSTTNHIQESLSKHLLKHIEIKKEDVLHVLAKKYNIYQVISQCVCEHVVMMKEEGGGVHVLYVFPFQKNAVYMWNDEKQSWDKMNQASLKILFEVVQKKLLQCYNDLRQINDADLNQLDLIECGMYLYEDGFEKKYNEFRKMVFQGLC